MNLVYHFFLASLSTEFSDLHKRKAFIRTLILSLIFLPITSASFFLIDFTIGGWAGIYGLISILCIALFFRAYGRFDTSINLLALASNSMFMIEVICSGGINSPALYWLMASPFFTLIFIDDGKQKVSVVWLTVCFLEFIVLFILETYGIHFSNQLAADWNEPLVLVFSISFMLYCAIVIMFRHKWSPKATAQAPLNLIGGMHNQSESYSKKRSFRDEASRLHRRMIWMAIILLPIFPDGLFLEGVEWKIFFSLRLGLVLYFILLLYIHLAIKFSPVVLAYMCLVPVSILCAYITSQVPDNYLFVYNLNVSTVFLVATLFLLWEIKYSVILFFQMIGVYLFFFYLNGRLDIQLLIESGAFLLFAIALASVGFSHLKFRSFGREFNLRLKLEKSNQELKFNNRELEHKQRQIAHQKERLNKRNDELKKLNDQLTVSEKRLKDSSALKDKFFSIISHDLRSPVATISSFLNLKCDESIDLDPEKEKLIFTGLKDSVDNLELLLENLLTWARSQMNSLKIVRTRIFVGTIIKSNLYLMKDNLERKKIQTKTSLKGKCKCFADKNMIDFVIRNLLSNAVKFTEPGGKIFINVSEKESKLFVSISDDGVGIESSNLTKIFDSREHFSRAGTNKEKGTGLGLILCKDFVQKNEGEISVDSELGRGTTFTVSFPTLEPAFRGIFLNDKPNPIFMNHN